MIDVEQKNLLRNSEILKPTMMKEFRNPALWRKTQYDQYEISSLERVVRSFTNCVLAASRARVNQGACGVQMNSGRLPKPESHLKL